MSKTILLVIFGIFTGLKILYYCRKFEDVKFNMFEDMTL